MWEKVLQCMYVCPACDTEWVIHLRMCAPSSLHCDAACALGCCYILSQTATAKQDTVDRSNPEICTVPVSIVLHLYSLLASSMEDNADRASAGNTCIHTQHTPRISIFPLGSVHASYHMRCRKPKLCTPYNLYLVHNENSSRGWCWTQSPTSEHSNS